MIRGMDGRQRAASAVAARRGELDMTQQELADAAGVDIKTIGNLESRGRWPIARSRARIEKALGWPVGELERMAADDRPPPISADLRRRIEREAGDKAPEVIAAIERTLAGEPSGGGRESLPRSRQAG